MAFNIVQGGATTDGNRHVCLSSHVFSKLCDGSGVVIISVGKEGCWVFKRRALEVLVEVRGHGVSLAVVALSSNFDLRFVFELTNNLLCVATHLL